jgi:hypothetical protein
MSEPSVGRVLVYQNVAAWTLDTTSGGLLQTAARLHKVVVISSTAELLLFSYDSASRRQLHTPEHPVVTWTFETGFEIPESRIQGPQT